MNFEIKVSNTITQKKVDLYSFDKNIRLLLLGNLYEDLNESVHKIMSEYNNGKKSTAFKIDGDCAFIFFLENDEILIYITETSNFLLYYAFSKDKIVISDDYLRLIENGIVKINLSAIDSLLNRVPVFPFININIMQISRLYKISDKIETLFVNGVPKIMEYKNKSIEELCKIAYDLVFKAVQKKTKNINNTIGIAMSGGIDSIVLAYCLNKLGKKICCIHWMSESYKSFNEDEYAEEFCIKHNIELIKIDITEKVNNLDEYFMFDKKIQYPYIHGGISWWDKTYKYLSERKIKYLITGLNGDYIFGTFFKRISDENIDYLDEDFLNNYKRHQNTIPIYNLAKKTQFDECKKKDTAKSESLENKNNVQKIFPVQLQRESMRLYLGKKYNIEEIAPYHDIDLTVFGCSIPRYFKSIPYGGKILNKPILKLAFFNDIPFSIVSRNSKSTFGLIAEKVIINNKDKLVEQILPNNILLKYLIDEFEIKKILLDEKRLIENKFIVTDILFIKKWLNVLEEKYEVDYV